MHQDNHFSKLRQVIEARNRTRGIELDAIFLDHRCPIAFMFVLGNMWVEDLGIRSDVHLKVKGRGHVIELVAMTSLSESFYTYSGKAKMLTPSEIPARITPTPILMNPKAC